MAYACFYKWFMVCLLEKMRPSYAIGLCVWFANGLCAWLQMAYVFSFCCIFLHNFAYEITLFNYHAMLDWSSFWRCLCVDVFTALDVYIWVMSLPKSSLDFIYLCDGFYCGNSFYVFNCCSYIYFSATTILCFSLYEASGNKSNVRIKFIF